MKNLHKILLIAVLAIAQACSDDNEKDDMNPTDGMIEVASVAVPDSDFKVVMFVDENETLEVGYNEFSLGLYTNDGEWLSNSHLSITPMMDMSEMDMMHSAPFESDEHDASMEMLQTFATVFVMPSMMGDWTLDVSIMEMDSEFEGEVSLPVTVTEPELTRLKSVTSNEVGYFITMINNPDFAVDSNEIEFTIHKRETMMSWPAVEDFTIEIEPEMPAMGHGSPNNVNPVHEGNGHYKGTVNFTMTGDWVINVIVKDGDTVILEDEFEVVL
ncbi:MAG: FixH family protein [Reichenbachiella sp.]|uniref:FixH family protein n=1 Tax=Reichenbachiella sp. TaxID=2184521 RepID=UPI0032978294